MAKKSKNNEVPQQVQQDEALFRAIGKNKKRKRRRIIITVISILVTSMGGRFGGRGQSQG